MGDQVKEQWKRNTEIICQCSICGNKIFQKISLLIYTDFQNLTNKKPLEAKAKQKVIKIYKSLLFCVHVFVCVFVLHV